MLGFKGRRDQNIILVKETDVEISQDRVSEFLKSHPSELENSERCAY